MWIEFVGSLLCSVRFIPRFSGSPLSPKTNIWIGHFRVHLSLRFKARLSAKSLIWKSVFIHIEIGTNYHSKSFALALKERLRGTRKWPIAYTTARNIAYLISHPQFNIRNTSYITSHSFFTGSLEPRNDQVPTSVASWLTWFRASHRYCQGTGSSPVEVLNFSDIYLRNCINCVQLENQGLLDFTSAVQYMKYFIYNFNF